VKFAVLAFFAEVVFGEMLFAQSQCGNCHRKQSEHYSQTPMARALLKPEGTDILSKSMQFRDGPWNYEIARDKGRTVYRVSDGTNTIAVPILWAFGAGIAGQTYVYEYEGSLYESRVSYYPRVKGLDLTLGARESKPESLVRAAGRKMLDKDVTECFGCHSTGGKFGTTAMQPGVQCAACHEDVQKHQASVRAVPRKLSKLSTEEVSELCGRCHRTWEQITINGPRGVPNVRFQPYRLTNSKCYDAEDRRISCVACHDPHKPLETRVAAYDGFCTSCHQAGAKPVCPTATSKCAECHMPKIEIPGSHMVFSDHQIRIVRNPKDYPN
jgi:hypothetical protein